MTARVYKDINVTIRVAVDYDVHKGLPQGAYSPAEPAHAEIKRVHLVDGLALAQVPRCILKKIDTRAIEEEILNEIPEREERVA